MVTRSKYDHVAMVVRFGGGGGSAGEGKLVIFEALRETGVGICEWDRFINKKWYQLYSRVVYR